MKITIIENVQIIFKNKIQRNAGALTLTHTYIQKGNKIWINKFTNYHINSTETNKQKTQI